MMDGEMPSRYLDGAHRLQRAKDEGFSQLCLKCLHGFNGERCPACDALDVREVIAEQIADEALWFEPRTAPEAYLQQALRRLHGAVGV